MRSTKGILAALTILLLSTACAAEEAEEGGGDTESLTRELLTQPTGDGRSTPLAADPSSAEPGARVPVQSVGFNRGSGEAPVKVVEFSDYGCGFCRKSHDETFPTILDDYIETGMVEWKFVPFVTGMWDSSLPVTEAVECAYVQSEEAFEALNARLWDGQATWKASGDPLEVVRGWMEDMDAEVDLGAFDACVAENERFERVTSSTTLARQLGIRGTPTFIVLGYPPLQGALPLEVWEQVLSAVHREAMQRMEEGPDRQGADAGDSGGPGTGEAPDTTERGGA